MNFEAKFNVGQKVFAARVFGRYCRSVSFSRVAVVWQEITRVSFEKGCKVKYYIFDQDFDEKNITVNSGDVGQMIIDAIKADEEARIEDFKKESGETK